MADSNPTDLVLDGCRVTPLAGYLKGLAVLRIISEQEDPSARGFWQGDSFVLRSRLGEEEILDFFLDRYCPTPVVAPWNGGSGFGAGDDQGAIGAIERSDVPRFALYRRVIDQVRAWPEMPRTFRTVAELVETLGAEVDKARPGKKRDRWQELLDDERRAREGATASLGDDADPCAELAWIADLMGPTRRAAAAWWKAVKKLRTECLGLARGRGKEELLKTCRARLPEECLAWLDATYAVRSDGSPFYNPVLGTGGNEGRLDLSNNFMQRLVELLGDRRDRLAVRLLLRSALHRQPTAGLPKTKIGQFDPGQAGGFNQGAEFETKDFKTNPWDFVFSIEGATTLGASVHKRMKGDARGNQAAPFTVHFSGAGFASSAAGEKGRAELWLPVWRHPACHAEVQHLFREGRSTVGRREARTGLDFTRAVRTLGVSRGIDEFARYAFLERRGKSYVALPAGRLPVRFNPRVRLLDDLDPILERVDQFLRGLTKVPASLESARRNIDEALYECSVSPAPERFRTLVAALGGLERHIAARASSGAVAPTRPLTGLRPDWVTACDDGSVEARIAAALASVRGDKDRKVGPLRSNLAGVDPQRSWLWSTGRGQHRWFGSDLVERLGGVLVQRLMDADRLNAAVTPLDGWLRLSAYDVVPFLYGDTDDLHIEALLWGFSLVAWHGEERREGLAALRRSWRSPLAHIPVPRGYALVKLVHWPGPVRDVTIRREPRIAAQLQADRVEDALEVAGHRLRVSGLRPLPVRSADDVEPRRLLAALLVPVRGPVVLEDLVLRRSYPGSAENPGSG